jgi:hypothetical protein
MLLNDQQRQLALGGMPVEIIDGSQTFYLLSKEQYDELDRIRTLFAEIEEIEFSPYEADDIADPNDGE